MFPLNRGFESSGMLAPSRVKIGCKRIGSSGDQNGLQRSTVGVVGVLPGTDPATGHPVG